MYILFHHNLLCILGPVCEDPGHPPDGQQIAVSYEQGEEVQFSCLRPGYEPYSDEPIRCDKSNLQIYFLISINIVNLSSIKNMSLIFKMLSAK